MTRLMLPTLLTLLAVGAAGAQASVTTATKVYPLVQSGKLNGCQLGFSVVRRDAEFSDGALAQANGLIVFDVDRGAIALRLGIATDAEFQKFVAPDRAYFFANYKSNSSDFISAFESTDVGFRVFNYRFGPATEEVFRHFLSSGKVEILYAGKDAKVDAPFAVDLHDHPSSEKEWLECISALVDKRS